ncbi:MULTISPECIES: hypothetical protein [Streptomyces]|uniref:hypothetical protein n=1 Tax=Streptomyces TaxID=1883 RepID=UPI000A08F57F|nr:MULTISPECIES: hypothetical protein [Streptomyces]MBO7936426.1 hypothetical protein [Streptomyces sp. S9]MCX4739023.1 hypothetical protein [Streptomyces antibioticus]MCX5169195.1 hypothetical protein [Streptomyces antibioticus]SMF06032.1 hypothetical protein SAMN02745830_01371 [Streptomyces sp. Amel2xC10]
MVTGALRRWAAALPVALVVAVLLGLLAPGTAQAAPGSCDGMRKVRTVSFRNGSVQVYKTGGRVCARTVAKHPGGQRRITVSVQARGHVAVKKGRRHAASSPSVQIYAGRRCVWVKGWVGRDSGSSGWILC